MTEESLFLAALEKRAPAERQAFLEQACGADVALRARVQLLLEADARVRGILEREAPQVETPAQPAAAGVGSVVAGRYKLLEKIGEGGMGTVWVAEQTEPVRRKVALKLVKPGMDSKSLLARFEAERQALALMDHPNIAKVLDGGITEAGRPFFVMEYLKGVPITDYCDATRLNVRERLELFAQVCHAVQHAHQKGIIHRDLKPSNILVAPYDDRPVPKVIDFGIAKAMHQALTDHTLHTGHGTVLGTPLYMSPEQTHLNNLDVDTRADIYSLGVLLYELLTGTTPLEKKRFKEAAWDEVRRIIREEEPPRPSARLSSTDTLPSLAACRHAEPADLTKLVRGELDWIAMKALDKDRSRRYATANEFAVDIGRYLAGESVSAVPPSAGYRLRKFARRHRAALATATVIAALLVLGIVGTTVGLIRARVAEKNALLAQQAEARRAEGEREAKRQALAAAEAEKRANAQAQKRLAQVEKGNEILTSIFTDLDVRKLREGTEPLEAVLARRLVQAATQLEGEAVGDALVVAALQETLGISLLSLGHPQDAVPLFKQSLETHRERLGAEHEVTIACLGNLGAAYRDAGKLDFALPLLEETMKLRKAKQGPDHPDTITAMNNLGVGYLAAGKPNLATPLLEETLKLRKARQGFDHRDTLTSMNNLALAYRAANKLDLARPLFEETLQLRRDRFGADHPDTLTCMGNLAWVLMDSGKLDEAVALSEETLKLRRARLGSEHPDTITSINNLALVYRAKGKMDQALPLLEEALKLRQTIQGAEHPDTIISLNNLAAGYRTAGKLDQALPLFEQSVRLMKAKQGPDHPDTLLSMDNLAEAYRSAGKLNLAVPLQEETLKRSQAARGADHPHTLSSMNNLAACYQELGKLDQALPLYEEALTLRKARQGVDHPDTLTAMNNLAECYRAAGKKDEALALHEETLKLRRSKLGVDHPDTLASMSNLAELYRVTGKIDLSLKLQEEAFNLKRAKQGDDDPDTLKSMNNLALAYKNAAKLEVALPLFQDALLLMRAKLGPVDPQTLTCMANLGNAYKDVGKTDQALPLLEEAALGVEAGRFKHEHTLVIVKSLIALREQLKQFPEAEVWRRKWVAAVKERSGADSIDYSGELAPLGGNLLQQQKWPEAETVLRDCLAIRERSEPDDWRTFNTRSSLGGALLGQKKYAEAEPLLLAGYEGMKSRVGKIPNEVRKTRLTEAASRLVQLYEALDRKEDASHWRQEQQSLDKP